jgi:hypothetical protein
LFDESGRLVVTEAAAEKAAPAPKPEGLEKIEPLKMPEPLEIAQLPDISELPEIDPIPKAEPLQQIEPMEIAELQEISELPEVSELPEIQEPGMLEPEKIMPPVAMAEKKSLAVETRTEEPQPEPQKPAPLISAKASTTTGPSIFKRAAKILGAELLDQGEYFFPRKGYKDLKLDLSVTPVMEFTSGQKALLIQGEKLSLSDQDIIQSFWNSLIVVNVPERADIRDLLTPLCPVVHRGGCDNKIMFEDSGITVSVQGEYIFDKDDGPGKTCLTLIEIEDQKTPNAFGLYLSSMMIDVSEWIDSGSYFGPVQRYETLGAPAQPAAEIAQGESPREFVRQLAAALEFKYEEQLEITFDYAGFQVKTHSNLLSASPGREILVDYGEFQGDALKSVETTGFRVVQVKPGMDDLLVLRDLLRGLSIKFKENPTFWAAERRRIHNSSIQVPGLLMEYSNSPDEIGMLVSLVPIHPQLISFLNQSGIRVIRLAR